MANWYYDSAVGGGTGAGTSWANARTSLATMTSVVAGDSIYVAHTHAEAPGSNITINFPGTVSNPSIVLCVNKAGSVPPVSADWRATGSVGTTGAFSITINGSAYVYGLTFNIGIGSATSGLTINLVGTSGGGGTVASWQHFDTCVMRISTTSSSTSCRVNIGSSGTNVGCRCIMTNTQFHFANAAQNISHNSSAFEWRNTATPFPNVAPTTMSIAYGTPGTWVMEGIDFSSMSGKAFFSSSDTYLRTSFSGCKIPSSTLTSTITHPSAEFYVTNSGPASSPAISQLSRYALEGSETTDTVIARVNGATDGVLPFSRSYLNTNNPTPLFRPYLGIPFAKWNDTTATNLTLTIYGIWNNGSGVPTNGDIWFETQYLADATSPLMKLDHTSRKPNYQSSTTAWTADTSDWTAGTVAARANTTVYTTGAQIKVASNPGRVFFATTASGTSAGSEPAGFASAVDGGSVTDGTVTFRAGYRFKMTITLSSPQTQLAGPIYVFPKNAFFASTAVIWLDPEIA